ncbi:CBO0543 family protein [Niallia nealsonii]|uniref:Uncharacterized protein n=1 Tax=Niallia nealsonii TaxID=115979 RepID=A0A2N0Z488_9BACI|nr:CBO0543 family protein [Niallia nealsonii]PKG24341.1 hypothetical protein CWS01_06910 [Niallia nealsonii]
MKNQVFEDSYKKTTELNQDIYQGWMDHSLFTWHWWIGIALIVIPLLLWLKFRNKNSQDRLLFAGVVVAIISAALDYMGTFFGKWRYDYEVYPALSNYIPFSFFALPIAVMFLLQVKPKMNPFLKALIFAVFSIIALPIVKWIGIYEPVKWNYLYSFIIQYFIYLIAHYISRKTKFQPLEE